MGDWFEEQAAILKHAPKDGVCVECGPGFRKYRDDFIGIDPVPKDKPANMGIPCIAELEGTSLTVDKHFKENSLSFLCAGHAVHYEPDLVAMYKVWLKLLQPGAKCAVIDLRETEWQKPGWDAQMHCGTIYGWKYFWRTEQETRKACEEAGFEIVESGDASLNWSYIVVGRKPLVEETA